MNEEAMKVFFDVFHPSLPRLAPGDPHSTRRALEALYGPQLGGAAADLRVLDIGCGNGVQTLRLVQELDCRVTAVDNHPPFLAELERRATALGVADRIVTRCADMKELDLGEAVFDLVWAEGSAFVLGIEGALKAWRGYLDPGGALGFSDLAWLRDDPPEECRRFFGQEYPAIETIGEVLGLLEKCGYNLLAHFTLPESSWLDLFYDPLARRLDEVEGRYAGNEVAGTVLARCRREIDMYRRYSQYYGYEFFLARPRS